MIPSQAGCEIMPSQSSSRFVQGGDSSRFPLGVNYSYHYADIVSRDGRFTAAEAMAVFQANPSVFPFKISGCSSFIDGGTCRLDNSTRFFLITDDTAEVKVSTTSTSVRFTVISSDYFDAAGSTVTFSTELVDGKVRLVHDAVGLNADPLVALSAVNGGARSAWREQADRLAKLLSNTK